MAHIDLPEGQPGIVGPLVQFPNTGQHLRAIRDELFNGPSILSKGEREIIALFVSSRNQCVFCSNSHGEFAESLLKMDRDALSTIIRDPETAPISELMKAMLSIAGSVQIGGRRVTDEQVARARAAGADDKAIHDTVLIAAMFCAYNRYVDGLDTDIPAEDRYGVAPDSF